MKIFRIFLQLSSALPEFLRIVEDFLLSGSKQWSDLLPHLVPHGLDFCPLFLSDCFNLGFAGINDLLHLLFLLVGEV